MKEEGTFNAPKFLILSTTFAAFGFLVMIFLVPVPNAVENVLYTLIGGIVGKWFSVVDYFFGSSSGSKAKSDLLGEITGTGDGTSKTSSKSTIHSERVTTSETPAAKPPEE